MNGIAILRDFESLESAAHTFLDFHVCVYMCIYTYMAIVYILWSMNFLSSPP